MTSYSSSSADESLSGDNFELVDAVESVEQNAKSVANESVELLRQLSAEISETILRWDFRKNAAAAQKVKDAKEGVFGTFAARFTGVSNMIEDEEVVSAPVQVAGMEWAIVLKRESGLPYTSVNIRRMSPFSSVCKVFHTQTLGYPDGSRRSFEEESEHFDASKNETLYGGHFSDKALLREDCDKDNGVEDDSILVEDC
ncbi:hypothetical protein PRIPAC_94032 [Pristionchus pacificus]|uniref:Uncharacterized protein n=1 Tax=Pristionchus pacificus TaxID=54126 RepID=A0A2A6BIA3_PRIPA|nr:hypothetical protein PRIPAC_94032 [Pristionchus pacificus]|eukprot:PDM65655.1 hypothetical protein PRIPAC_45569 [Pristionchus pacificus]